MLHDSAFRSLVTVVPPDSRLIHLSPVDTGRNRNRLTSIQSGVCSATFFDCTLIATMPAGASAQLSPAEG